MKMTRKRRPLARLAAVAACLAPALLAVGIGPRADAAPISVTSLSAGGLHTCAALSDGTVRCWGNNGSGELGNGTHTDATVPVRVQGLTQVVAVTAGFSHTCALDQLGRVWCWGSDAFGELGNGTISTGSPTPVLVAGLHATQVSAGDGFTCALSASNVWCWGENVYGELGNGTTNDASTPQHVLGLDTVKSISAGYFHACALNQNGTVMCWGSNTFGALGNGTTTQSSVPVAVSPLGGVTSVSAGDDDTCAVAGSGALKCWGDNFSGQLGDGTNTDRLVPTQVAGLTSGVFRVGTGQSDTCALVGPTPNAFCWGTAYEGELGSGVAVDTHYVPAPVFGMRASAAGGGSGGPVQLATGTSHSCVVLAVGTVSCWGQGQDGRLGNGTQLDRAAPTPVVGLPATGPVAAVAEGAQTGCALLPTLDADCWGDYPGNGAAGPQTAPVPVSGLAAKSVVQVSAGRGGCALTKGGAIRCWGANSEGEVGDGTTTPRTTPVAVAVPMAGQVTTGAFHTCAALVAGGVKCWGDNSHGQLGDGSTIDRYTPVAVKGLAGHVLQVTAGSEHTCAVLVSGAAECWGHNQAGQLGDGTTSDRSKAVAVTGLSGVVQVAAGLQFSCALLTVGGVVCWGDNSMGELGNGSTTSSLTPVAVTGLSSGVVSLAAGWNHACATLQGGQVQCWGADNAGQIGNGTTGGFTSTPLTVSALATNATPVSSLTSDGACAVSTQGHALCWGANDQGQLGNGTTTSSNVPVGVSGL